MRNRLGKRSAGQADTSNALRPPTRSQRIQPRCDHTQSSCCAKSQHPRHMGWVIDSDPATPLRCAQDDEVRGRSVQGDGGATLARGDGGERRAYAMVANNAL